MRPTVFIPTFVTRSIRTTTFVFMTATMVSLAALVPPDANPALYFYDAYTRIPPIKKPTTTNETRREQMIHNSISGRRVWIVGASRGLGAGLAKVLYQGGARLILSARDVDALERLAEDLHGGDSPNDDNGNGRRKVGVVPLDVSDIDGEAIPKAVTEAIAYHGGIDLLILNAGAGQLHPALLEGGEGDDVGITMPTTRGLMDLNFFGPVRITTELARRDGWGLGLGSGSDNGKISDKNRSSDKNRNSRGKKMGHIVVTSSVAGIIPVPLCASYAASKHALHGYFTSLRAENSDWLRVDLPCPGPIDTEFQKRVKTVESEGKMKEECMDDVVPPTEGIKDASPSLLPLPPQPQEASKMPLGRCVDLIISSIIGPSSLMYETWISRQPTLTFLYLERYLPDVFNAIMGRIGPVRKKAWEEGLPLYEAGGLIRAAAMLKEEEKKEARSNYDNGNCKIKLDKDD